MRAGLLPLKEEESNMANKKEVSASTQDAREQSKATLEEQGAMKPVPSQDDADRIKLGEKVNADEKQPNGPAADAAEEVAASNAETQAKMAGAAGDKAAYKTRDAKA